MFKLFLFAISFSPFLFPHQNLANSNNQSENNSSISASWTNFYGQNTELSRQKRFFEPISWTMSTILMLIFWNGFLAPFLQAQLSLKISIIGWFDDEVVKGKILINIFEFRDVPNECGKIDSGVFVSRQMRKYSFGNSCTK